MAAEKCPGFVAEFNTYNISGYDSMLLTSFLQGVSQSTRLLKHHLAAKGSLGFIVEFNIIWQPKGCSGFVVEFNICNISGNDPMLLTSFLQEVSQLQAAQDLLLNLTSFSSRRLP